MITFCKMKITRKELEYRVIRQLKNYYNYVYTPGELSRGRTAYYFIAEDLKIFNDEGGNLLDFRDNFLVKLRHEMDLRDEQEDFLWDLICEINRITNDNNFD